MSDRTQTLVGLSLVPEAAAWPNLSALARTADQGGLDLLGIQDHPYQWRFLDTLSLIGVLFGRTRRIRIFPDVANLPLRLPSVLGKTAASLDVMSGGRFELGVGAGAFWDAVEAMGGPRRTPGEAVDAFEEAIEVIRLMWSGERAVTFAGAHYSIRGVHPGEPPRHAIELWVDAYGPRMLRLIGRLADGWVPSLGRVTHEQLRSGQALIDEAAAAARCRRTHLCQRNDWPSEPRPARLRHGSTVPPSRAITRHSSHHGSRGAVFPCALGRRHVAARISP